jgi:nitroimidazol reductase NimA-like FMN-containing flavoprotein (pyridoxamine 5'-phosphate oxidase superfamily)
MADHTATELDAPAIADFLDTQETGVLSLAASDESYAIPVSFAYEPENSRVYFRLGYAPGSQKQSYVEATDHATFVVYDQTADGWKSVVARGQLETLSETDLESRILQAVRKLDIPYFRVFDRPTDELDFKIVALQVEQLNGLVEGG